MRSLQPHDRNHYRKLRRIALAVGLAVVASVFVFGSTVAAVDFYWMHFRVETGNVSAADGVAVMTLGVVLGSVLAAAAAIVVLVRFWARATQSEESRLV